MSDSLPLLTVVTACFNHGQYLRESAESVLRQTERNIELVIVVDGATDDSMVVALDLAGEDDRVGVIWHQENRGLAAAQNAGIRVAQAPWVLKVDADDWISETFVEQILGAADQNPSRNIIYSPAHVFGAREYVYRYPRFDPAKLITDCLIPGPAAFRRELWVAVGGYDETMVTAEDRDLYIRAHLAVGLVPHQLPTPLWHYREHAGPRASALAVPRRANLIRYWRGHRADNIGMRTWAQWCAEQRVAA